MLPVRLRGIDPKHENEVAQIATAIVEGKLADLTPGSDRVILGSRVAETMGLALGDSLTLLVPTTDANGTPEPRLRDFVVAGIFETEVQDFDGQLLIAAIDDVRTLLPNPDGRMS